MLLKFLIPGHVKKIGEKVPEKLDQNHSILIKNSKFAEYPDQYVNFR